MSRDGAIVEHDIRSSERIKVIRGAHDGPVCSLRWNSPLGLLASGADDGLSRVWRLGQSASDFALPVSIGANSVPSSAVKGLAWCPGKSELLAAGGGINDGRLRVFNTSLAGSPLTAQTATGGQVCGLHWSPDSTELLSLQGYPIGPVGPAALAATNQLIVWRYPGLVRALKFVCLSSFLYVCRSKLLALQRTRTGPYTQIRAQMVQ